MRISIAILTKNSERTIGYSLSSLYRQILPKNVEMELIIIDGYSQDNTIKIVNSWIERFKRRYYERLIQALIIQERANRVGLARNIALKVASGEWILWLDDDNVIPQNYLYKAYEKITSNNYEKLAVIYPRRSIPIFHSKNVIEKVIACYLLTIGKVGTIKEPSFSTTLSYEAMQGTFCKTELLLQIGGFNSLLPAAEDIDILSRLVKSGYYMDYFDSTLYFFVRSSLKSWFKQAMYWGYGQYLLSYINTLSAGIKSLDALQAEHLGTLRNYIKVLRNSFRIFYEATRITNDISCIVSLPSLYIYRRLGYYLGWHYAQKHIKSYYYRKKV